MIFTSDLSSRPARVGSSESTEHAGGGRRKTSVTLDWRAGSDMDDAERALARELILAQEALLVAVARGDRDLDEADIEYKRRHNQLRQLLAKDTLPCYCPWGSVKAWAYSGYEDWQAALEQLRLPLRRLLTETEDTPWRLVLYRRDGDSDDVPFLAFEDGLTDEKWVVLDTSLRRELAIQGTTLLRNDRKAHTMPCAGGPPQPNVLMYKVREGAPSGEVVLRVFFDTAPDHTIILLHGYDKGADPSDGRERAEANTACERRAELRAQMADPSRAAGAVASRRE